MDVDVKNLALKLLSWADDRSFKGYDPYDALNSPFAGVLSLGTKFGRIALTQILRRSAINFRPALLIKPGVNPKALALFLEESVALGELEIARKLARKTLDIRSEGYSGAAWGYNFPWQNRFQLLPRFTPTIVNTAFAGHALLDFYEAAGDEQALDAALSTPAFILNDLNRLRDGDDSFCFSYTPLDRNFVHNANLLGASLLARIARRYARPELLDPALCALRYSARRQHDDGSWFYAERREQNWIDSFHTGFNLEAIRRVFDLGLASELREGYEKGARFYADRFFLADGTPKYYADRLYLVDIHAPAQAISFFAAEPGYEELAERVLLWTLANMYDASSGVFFFRKKGKRVVKTPYMRWSEAWGLRALVKFAVAREG